MSLNLQGTAMVKGILSNRKKHIIQLRKLLRFISSRNPFFLISNNLGCGTTKLIILLANVFSKKRHIIHIKAHRHFKPKQLITLLTKACKSPPHNNRNKIHFILKRIITHIDQKPHKYLIIVDDAHLLPFSILAALFHISLLQDASTVKLKLLLSGKPEIASKINDLIMWRVPELKLTQTMAQQFVFILNKLTKRKHFEIDPNFPIESTEKSPLNMASLGKTARRQVTLVSILGVIITSFCFASFAWYYEHPTNLYFSPPDPTNITIIN